MTHSRQRATLKPCLLFFVGLLLACCFGLHEGQLLIYWEKGQHCVVFVIVVLREASVEILSPSTTAVALAVVTVGFVGLLCCLRRLLTQTLSMKSNFQSSCATVANSYRG